MTVLAVRRSPVVESRRLFAPVADSTQRRTLEDLVIAALDERRLRGTAPCLVCDGRVDDSGECAACGSRLD